MIVPGIVISIVTGLIIFKLTVIRTRRRSMQASRTTTVRRNEKQINVTLIAVAPAFLFLRPPYEVAFCIHLQIVLNGENPYDHKDCSIFMAYGISYILAVLNYSLNFLLYFATGNSFRKEFYASFKCQPTGFNRTSATRMSITRSHSADLQRRRSARNDTPANQCSLL